jgi:hypothetical protein
LGAVHVVPDAGDEHVDERVDGVEVGDLDLLDDCSVEPSQGQGLLHDLCC